MILLTVLTWLSYSNTLEVPFLFDDHHNITKNPSIQINDLSWASLRTTTSENPTPRPLAYLTFALNYFAHGMDVKGFHIVNITIHLINGCLVYFLARKVFALDRQQQITGNASRKITLAAIFTAAVFVTHPIQISSVTYIVQRMASLSALLQMAALLCYFHARTSGDRVGQITIATSGLIFWVFALGTKQNALILPFAILLCEWIFFQQGRLLWLRKALILAIPIALITWFLLYAYKGEKLYLMFEKGYAKRDFTLYERVLTESRIIGHYLTQIIWPHPSRFVLVYDFPTSTGLLQPWTTLLWSTLLATLVTASLFVARHLPFVAFGALWFLIFHIPESTIVPLELVYEHRNYLPILGILLLVSHCVIFHVFSLRSSAIASVAVIIPLILSTRARNHDWLDEETFWKDNIAKQPGESRAHFNLGIVQAKKDQHSAAIASFSRALELNQNFQSAIVRRGSLHRLEGKLKQALLDFTTAIEMNPANVYREHLFGDAYLERGSTLSLGGLYSPALIDLKQAITLLPKRPEPHFQIGLTFEKMAKYAEAIHHYTESVRINPGFTESRNNLAWLLATCGDLNLMDGRQAVTHALAVCELTNWENYEVLDTLAAAYARDKQFSKAVHWQQHCLVLAPEDVREQYATRLTLFRTGKPFATPAPSRKNTVIPPSQHAN